MWIPISHICVRSFRSLSHGSILSHSFARSHSNCIAVDQRVCKFVTTFNFPSLISLRYFCTGVLSPSEEKHWNLHSDGTIINGCYIHPLIWAANRTMQINAEMHSTAHGEEKEKKKLRTSRSEGRIITSRTQKIMLDVSVNNKWSSFLNWHFQFNFLHIHHLRHNQ